MWELAISFVSRIIVNLLFRSSTSKTIHDEWMNLKMIVAVLIWCICASSIGHTFWWTHLVCNWSFSDVIYLFWVSVSTHLKWVNKNYLTGLLWLYFLFHGWPWPRPCFPITSKDIVFKSQRNSDLRRRALCLGSHGKRKQEQHWSVLGKAC